MVDPSSSPNFEANSYRKRVYVICQVVFFDLITRVMESTRIHLPMTVYANKMKKKVISRPSPLK